MSRPNWFHISAPEFATLSKQVASIVVLRRFPSVYRWILLLLNNCLHICSLFKPNIHFFIFLFLLSTVHLILWFTSLQVSHCDDRGTVDLKPIVRQLGAPTLDAFSWRSLTRCRAAVSLGHMSLWQDLCTCSGHQGFSMFTQI